jgi:hypothetical protein
MRAQRENLGIYIYRERERDSIVRAARERYNQAQKYEQT